MMRAATGRITWRAAGAVLWRGLVVVLAFARISAPFQMASKALTAFHQPLHHNAVRVSTCFRSGAGADLPERAACLLRPMSRGQRGRTTGLRLEMRGRDAVETFVDDLLCQVHYL